MQLLERLGKDTCLRLLIENIGFTLPFIPAAPPGGISAPLRQAAGYYGEGE